MGLRCSLLGHDFGEPEVEREREERGNEVVETVREVKTCARCGSESVVSENTEVRSIRPADDVSQESDVQSAVERVSGATAGAGGAADAGGATVESAESATDDAGVSEFDDVSAEEDDGLILDAEDESPDEPLDREPGEWPDADDTRQNERDEAEAAVTEVDASGDAEAETADAADDDDATDATDATDDDAEFIEADEEAEHAPWPDTEGEDEGFDAEPSSGGGLNLSEVESEADPEAADDDTEYIESSGIASAGSLDPDRVEGAGDTLVCPQCGHQTQSSGSSLRAGDICPECRKGYLAEE